MLFHVQPEACSWFTGAAADNKILRHPGYFIPLLPSWFIDARLLERKQLSETLRLSTSPRFSSKGSNYLSYRREKSISLWKELRLIACWKYRLLATEFLLWHCKKENTRWGLSTHLKIPMKSTFQIKRKAILSTNKQDRTCPCGFVGGIVVATLGKISETPTSTDKSRVIDRTSPHIRNFSHVFLNERKWQPITPNRITVFVLGFFGILCSSFACLSPNYFSYVSLRNDTFCEIDKRQPKPFEFATQANVGLFRYEILEVFEFPWPPTEQCDMYARRSRELEQLPASRENEDTVAALLNVWNRFLQNKFPDEIYDDDDSVSTQNDTMLVELTKSPYDSAQGILEGTPVPPVLPGSNKVTSPLATLTPTPAPTRSNPNDSINVEIGVVKAYPAGVDFDKLFTNGQKGALWAPILATIGLAFGTVEYYCCIYKCSWLPTALFLYAALMLQLMTLFLFMTQDFW